MKPSHRPLTSAAALLFLASGLATASVHVTVDRRDGSWIMSQTSDLHVVNNAFLQSRRSVWLTNISGPSVSGSNASFDYSGTYNGNAVSGTGTISLGSISDQPYNLTLTYGSAITVAGTFTSISFSNFAAFNNPAMWSTLQSGTVDPFGPATNAQAQITAIPEPSALLLSVLGFLPFLRRRR